MKRILIYAVITSLTLVSGVSAQEQTYPAPSALDCSCTDSLDQSESNNFLGGWRVLETGRKMALEEKTVIKGSCWDFVNAVFTKAGVGSNKTVIFRSKKSGPYAKADMVKPGDWIYHVNHNYNNIEHSAIFVCWKDYEKRIAITLSYAGMNRNQPGKYGTYNLKSIYSIFRPNMPSETKSSSENTGN